MSLNGHFAELALVENLLNNVCAKVSKGIKGRSSALRRLCQICVPLPAEVVLQFVLVPARTTATSHQPTLCGAKHEQNILQSEKTSQILRQIALFIIVIRNIIIYIQGCMSFDMHGMG